MLFLMHTVTYSFKRDDVYTYIIGKDGFGPSEGLYYPDFSLFLQIPSKSQFHTVKYSIQNSIIAGKRKNLKWLNKCELFTT